MQHNRKNWNIMGVYNFIIQHRKYFGPNFNDINVIHCTIYPGLWNEIISLLLIYIHIYYDEINKQVNLDLDYIQIVQEF